MAEVAGLKTQFFLGSTKIAQVSAITPPQPQRDTVEVEDLDPADQIKKKLSGLIDGGDATLRLNFDPSDAGHTAILTAFYAGTAQTCTIKLAGKNGWEFTGYITGFAPNEMTGSEVMQADVTIAVSGKPTYKAAIALGE